jgi:hypothetical protein
MVRVSSLGTRRHSPPRFFFAKKNAHKTCCTRAAFAIIISPGAFQPQPIMLSPDQISSNKNNKSTKRPAADGTRGGAAKRHLAAAGAVGGGLSLGASADAAAAKLLAKSIHVLRGRAVPGAGGEGDTLDTFLVLCLMHCGVLVAAALGVLLVAALLDEEEERNPAASERLLQSPEFCPVY